MHRRTVLQTTGALTVATGVGLAGCLDVFESGSSDSAAAWLVDPSHLDADYYHAGIQSTAAVAADLAEIDDRADEVIDAQLAPGFELSRPDPRGITRRVTGGQGFGDGFEVVTGEFDQEALEEDLQAVGFEADGEYDGYTLYHDGIENAGTDDAVDASAARRAYAVEADAIVRAEVEDPVSLLESVIDTAAGEATGYADVNEDFERLLGLADERMATVGLYDRVEETNPEGGPLAGSIGQASTTRFDEPNTTITNHVLFEDEDDIDEAEVEDVYDTQEERAQSQIDDLDVDEDIEYAVDDITVDGRVVSVEQRLTTEFYFLGA